jgi:sporulation protein YlmC with PRC-barrel domain
MRWRSFVSCGVLAFATLAASAQIPPAPTGAQAPPGTSGPQGLADAGVWRASDLIGRVVFTSDNQNVGEVKDVILNRDGRLDGMVLDIGGFLGIGEHRVAVPLHELRIEPARTSATSGTVGGLPPSTATGAEVRADIQMNTILVPGRIVLNVLKDQIRSAPQFEGRR